MRLDKIRGLYSRIDTDISMDHRIKNRLLYHENVNEAFDKGKYGERYERGDYGAAISRMRRLKPVLPSLMVLMLIAVVIIGIRASLFKSEEQEYNTVASAAPDSDSDGLSSLLDEFLDEASKNAAEEPPVAVEPKNDTEATDVIDDLSAYTNNSLTDQPVRETTVLGVDEKVVQENSIAEKKEKVTKNIEETEVVQEASAGDFYFAHFEVLANGSVKTSIPSLVIRMYGSVDHINPDDLTDIVLTRDGVPVDNNITAISRTMQFTWGYKEVTDFYFDFAFNNTEPGNYDLTGKYKGVPFDVYNKIIETILTDEPADEIELNSVGWVYQPNMENEPLMLTELVFHFEGLQNEFYISDLSDIKATMNGVELPIAFGEQVFRYYEADIDNTGDTSFNLILKEAFAVPGTYLVTGSYRGVPFTSMEMIIN